MVVGGMIVGGLMAGGMAAHYATKDRYQSMAREQEQQERLRQEKEQADQAERAAMSELQAVQSQTRAPIENKDDAVHKLEKLASLKQQGLITEEEFQKMKSKLI